MQELFKKGSGFWPIGLENETQDKAHDVVEKAMKEYEAARRSKHWRPGTRHIMSDREYIVTPKGWRRVKKHV